MKRVTWWLTIFVIHTLLFAMLMSFVWFAYTAAKDGTLGSTNPHGSLGEGIVVFPIAMFLAWRSTAMTMAANDAKTAKAKDAAR